MKASNARIGEILELQQELEDYSSESLASPLLAELYIKLLREESLWTITHRGYAAAATEYSGIGDYRNAQKYAHLALNTGHICRGSYHGEYEYDDLLQLRADPRKHDSWQFRLHPESRF